MEQLIFFSYKILKIMIRVKLRNIIAMTLVLNNFELLYIVISKKNLI